MILRQFHSQSLKSRTLFADCLKKCRINQSSVRPKSIMQWYNYFWSKFDDPIIKPPYKHCTQIGDPVLRHRATEIPLEKISSKEIVDLIAQMKKVLRSYNLVGLAAPQIGIAYRIIVMEASEQLKEKYPTAVYKARGCEILPMTIVINPILKVLNYNTKTFPEGCASVCGYTADVKRFEEVQLTGFNENGDAIDIHLRNWNARIAQHEVDHLNGQMFVDIMEKKSFSCATWQACNHHSGQLYIPFYPPKKLSIPYLSRKRAIVS